MTRKRPLQSNKSYLFAVALIKYNNNATKAAKAVFDLGSKGGKGKQRTAESMGSEYLRKPEVQKHVTKLLESADMNRNWLLMQLKDMAEQRKNMDLALKSLVEIAKLQGAYPKEGKEASVERSVMVNLVAPAPMEAKPPRDN